MNKTATNDCFIARRNFKATEIKALQRIHASEHGKYFKAIIGGQLAESFGRRDHQ